MGIAVDGTRRVVRPSSEGVGTLSQNKRTGPTRPRGRKERGHFLTSSRESTLQHLLVRTSGTPGPDRVLRRSDPLRNLVDSPQKKGDPSQRSEYSYGVRPVTGHRDPWKDHGGFWFLRKCTLPLSRKVDHTSFRSRDPGTGYTPTLGLEVLYKGRRRLATTHWHTRPATRGFEPRYGTVAVVSVDVVTPSVTAA